MKSRYKGYAYVVDYHKNGSIISIAGERFIGYSAREAKSLWRKKYGFQHAKIKFVNDENAYLYGGIRLAN